jgi:hypothetical protein
VNYTCGIAAANRLRCARYKSLQLINYAQREPGAFRAQEQDCIDLATGQLVLRRNRIALTKLGQNQRDDIEKSVPVSKPVWLERVHVNPMLLLPLLYLLQSKADPRK